MIIYAILSVSFIIGCAMCYQSYDFAIQLQQYDFGSNAAMVTWNKDALLSFGSGLIVTVLLILLYNEVQNMKLKKELKRKRSIAAKRLISKYIMELFFSFYPLNNKDYCLIDLENFPPKKLEDIFNEIYFNELKKIDLYSKSTVDIHKPVILVLYDNGVKLNKDVENTMMLYEAYFNAENLN